MLSTVLWPSRLAQVAQGRTGSGGQVEIVADRLTERHQSGADPVALGLVVAHDVARAHKGLQVAVHPALGGLERARQIGNPDRGLLIGEIFERIEGEDNGLNTASSLWP
jgi:hypothetical protein